MKMINLALCDDEYIEITYLSALVRKWAAERGITVYISDYESAESFLFVYEEDKATDILLLDIQMKNMNGMELARYIRGNNENIQIIFITGYSDFISEGYEISALHYLIKPVKEEKLFEVLDRAEERIKRNEQALLVCNADATVRVLLSDIIYIEAFAHYVVIKTKEKTIEAKYGIGEIEKSIGNTFIRCHRSYIVGLRHISRISKTDLILDNGTAIPLSRRLYNEVNRAFIEFYRGGK